jgi:anti-sigma-K factor RskA
MEARHSEQSEESQVPELVPIEITFRQRRMRLWRRVPHWRSEYTDSSLKTFICLALAVLSDNTVSQSSINLVLNTHEAPHGAMRQSAAVSNTASILTLTFSMRELNPSSSS